MPVLRLIPVLAIAGGLALPLAVAAQTPPPAPVPVASGAPMQHGHQHHRHASFMRALRNVNLTAAQQQQVSAFHDEEKKANLNADAATKQANAKKMRDQIMSILTPDQKTQLSAELHHARAPMPDPAASPASH